MRHTIDGKDEINWLHIEESYLDPEIVITVSNDLDEEMSITLDFDRLYRLIGLMLHIQQSVKQRSGANYPTDRR